MQEGGGPAELPAAKKNNEKALEHWKEYACRRGAAQQSCYSAGKRQLSTSPDDVDSALGASSRSVCRTRDCRRESGLMRRIGDMDSSATLDAVVADRNKDLQVPIPIVAPTYDSNGTCRFNDHLFFLIRLSVRGWTNKTSF